VGSAHYRRTEGDRLSNLDARRDEALALCARTCGPAQARSRLAAWRLFFPACGECRG
jgi:hypothetical protein